MALWDKIYEAFKRVAKSGSLLDLFGEPTPPERTIAFTVAMVALGAKLAKADGLVTRDEVDAFKEFFFIPPDQEKAAARVFDLARTDVTGFDAYARQLRRMFDAPEHRATLEDILDGLFHIAGADGEYDPMEIAFLREVADIFEISSRCFDRLRTRHDPDMGGDPYKLLGVEATDDLETIRKAWRDLVRETHPDRMMARGVPEEAVRMATERMRVLNAAYERIRGEKSGGAG